MAEVLLWCLFTVKERGRRVSYLLNEGRVKNHAGSLAPKPTLTYRTPPFFWAGMLLGKSLVFGVDVWPRCKSNALIHVFLHNHPSQHTHFLQAVNTTFPTLVEDAVCCFLAVACDFELQCPRAKRSGDEFGIEGNFPTFWSSSLLCPWTPLPNHTQFRRTKELKKVRFQEDSIDLHL